MSLANKIQWDNLPHEAQVGYGRAGLILRLNETECIKIYSPERSFTAEREYRNYERLLDAGFLVPKPKCLVEVMINRKTVKLPGKCEFMGIGLYDFQDLESVPAIIKEFIPGRAYGTKMPTIREIRSLLIYLNRLYEGGFLLEDAVPEDFIASRRGAVLIDCPYLFNRDEYKVNYSGDFESTVLRNNEGIIRDLRHEVRDRNYPITIFSIELSIARLLKW